MKHYTRLELISKDYEEIIFNKKSIGFISKKNKEWPRSNRYWPLCMKFLIQLNDFDNIDFYKFCTKSNKYHHIKYFEIYKNRFKSSIKEKRKFNNIDIYRMYMNGSYNIPLKCAITNIIIEPRTIELRKKKTSVMQHSFHHILVQDGKSIYKNTIGLFKDINYIDLTLNNEITIKYLQEIMITMLISETAHRGIHRIYKTDSDITYFNKNQWPYVLKSKNNYNKWISFLLNDIGISEKYVNLLPDYNNNMKYVKKN